MNLVDIIHRQPAPIPWLEGEKIPWNDPNFSQRMLQEHLSQQHDAASRRFAVIDKHVEWIHRVVLSERPVKILDLGCGPGLYTSRLSQLGHECVGIDFSPASVAYAEETARAENLRCSYHQRDIRSADYGRGYGLVMSIFGELNVFRTADAKSILRKAHQALAEAGLLLLEPHTFAAVRGVGEGPSNWYSSERGLFSDQPHLYLSENFWDAEQCVATTRYFIVDGLTGAVRRYASSMQAYTDEQYRALLEECGFGEIRFHSSLMDRMDEYQSNLMVIVARKRRAAGAS